MISEKTTEREARAARAFKWLAAGYVSIGGMLSAVYAVAGNWYLAVQALGTVAALAAIFGLLKLLRVRPVYSLYTAIVVFTFAAYTLGVACSLYKTLPGYDKILHMLSGTFTMMLALPLFYVLKSGHQVEKKDCALAVIFCLATALAVAGIWELAEYFLSRISDIDPQCVQATGVTDTMQDMIVCTVGALLGLPSLIGYYRTGEGGIMYGPTEIFIEKNLKCG